MPRLELPRTRPSEITAERYFHMRRDLLTTALGIATAAAIPAARATTPSPAGAPLTYSRNAKYSVTDKPNSFEEITNYNNFYEFGTDKSDPAANAGSLRTRPWSLTIAGDAAKTWTFTIEDILSPHPREERIYRHRCGEASSMLIPWV